MAVSMRRRLFAINGPNQRAFMRKVLEQRAQIKLLPGRHRTPGIAVYGVPRLKEKYGYRKVRFADLAKQEQNALRKWRLEHRIRKGTITPEGHYLRLRRGKSVPEGLTSARLRKHSERWLSFAWYALPKEKEKFQMKKGPMAGMKRFRRIHGMPFGKKELRQIYKQKKFVFKLLARNLPAAERRTFLKKMLSREMLTRTMSTRALIDYPTIPEVREETWANIMDLRQDRRMFGGYTHTRQGKDYLAPDYRQRGGGFWTSPVHEAVHQFRLYFFAKKLPIPIRPVKGAPFYVIEDVPWAQALDRLYGLREEIYKFDKKIGAPTAKDFRRKERAYADPIEAIENEADWSSDVGNRIGQWAYKKFGAEGGANYISLRIWGKNHEEAFGIVNKMQKQSGKKRVAEIVPIGREGGKIRKAA